MSTPAKSRGGPEEGAASGGATAAAPPKRRRPWWAWAVLGLLAVLIVVAILVFASQCGGPAANTGADPNNSAATGPPGNPAPAAAPAASAPGSPPPGAAPAPGSPAPAGAPTGPAVPSASTQAQINQVVSAAPITFAADRSELTSSGAATTDRVAQLLVASPTVTVTGYVAPVAMDTVSGQQLSEQRALAVAQRLAAHGVPTGQVQTRGAADSNPEPTLDASRRAEITVS